MTSKLYPHYFREHLPSGRLDYSMQFYPFDFWENPMGEKKEMTFGEKAVGLAFNPSGDPLAHKIKQLYAEIIDICYHAGNASHGHQLRHWELAIADAETAQMRAVKAATWRDT